MNSLMLASRLTARLKVRNLTSLIAEDAATLLDAMNGGIKEWFDGLPPKNKQTAASALVQAPVAITIAVLEGARGFSWVTPPFPVGGYADEAALIGKSVSIGGASPSLNRLDASSTLLKPHLGPGGDVPATFWGDAIGFPETSVRLVSTPVWEGAESGRWELRPLEGASPPWTGSPIQTGPPTHYATEPSDPTQRGNPFWMLRLWPLPPARGTVTFTLETTPPVLDMEALQVAQEIPVPDQDIPDLIPLCEERLCGSPLWHERADPRKTMQDAARSRERLARMWQPLDARPSLIPAPRHW